MADQVTTTTATNNATNATTTSPLEQKWEKENEKMVIKDDIAELKASLEGIDETTADEIINDVKVAADTVIKQIAQTDPIGAIKVNLLSFRTTNEMYSTLVVKRHSYEQVEKFAQAVHKLYKEDKLKAEELVCDFYIAWVSLFGLSDDEVTAIGMTRASIKAYKAQVFSKVDESLIPDWYKKANSKLVSTQYTAELSANIVYQATKAIGSLGTRVPEAIVETAGKTILNTVKAVDKVVKEFNKRAEIKKLQSERDAIDKKIAELDNCTTTTDTTPKF
jgi:hypothetical protein